MNDTCSDVERLGNCQAAVFLGAGRPFELRPFDLPIPGAGEALVRVECCTICGSDLHTISGARTEPTPSILGHEVIGVVDSVGDPPPSDINQNLLRPGERITWSTSVSCGNCNRCLRGLPQKCQTLAKYGHELAQGRYALSGGLAEYLLVRRGSTVVRIAHDLPAKVICPVSCATATIVAAYRTAGSFAGRRIMIFGAGMLGLTATAFARSHNASTVVVCDVNLQRLQRATSFGADCGVKWHPDTDSLRRQIMDECGADAFDLVLELSGSPEAVEMAIRFGDRDATRLTAVVFDWAGTTVDHGSCAPAIVFQELFKRRGIEISMGQSREPMGMAKRDHLAAIAAMPNVAKAWQSTHGHACQSSDLDSMYEEFLPLQESILGQHSDTIPGVPQAVETCRGMGLKIGSSTGYTRALMKIVSEVARQQGYVPDCVMCAEDAPRGRPAPYLLYEAAKQLDVYPMWSIVAVDDTPFGIKAGRNAGCWTVGVTRTGNGVGLSVEEIRSVAQSELRDLCDQAERQLRSAGAHYTIESVADIAQVVGEIDRRLVRGESPIR